MTLALTYRNFSSMVKAVGKKSTFSLLRIALSPINHLLKTQSGWQIFNTIYEKSPWRIVDIGVRCISIPKKENVWTIQLLDGHTIETEINPSDAKTWQLPLSYKWHAPSLNWLELLLGRYYDLEAYYIDIGANAGLRSLLALSNNRPTLMVEPNDEVNQLNTARAQRNGFSNFEIIEKGISSQEGTAHFYIDHSSYLSSFDRTVLSEEAFSKETEVSLTTLDRIVSTRNITSEFFAKIDVEGHEWEVIQGAQQCIETLYPSLIIEINERGEHTQKIFRFFCQLGYSIFSIARRPKRQRFLKRISSSMKEEAFLSNDFLFVRNTELISTLHPYEIV